MVGKEERLVIPFFNKEEMLLQFKEDQLILKTKVMQDILQNTSQ